MRRRLTTGVALLILLSIWFVAPTVAIAGDANFIDSGQTIGSSASFGIALGDLDGDGDLDAFVTNYNQANKIWLNNGSGNFTGSGQTLGSSPSWGVALGDLDLEGDLDAFVANTNNQANKIWLNNRSGNFTDSGQTLGSSTSVGIALGDLDGDGDLDAFVSNYYQPNKVWLNNVLTAELLLNSLIDDVVSLNLSNGIDNSLDAKLDAAMKAIEDINNNNDVAAINALEAFISSVEAQRGKQISTDDADALIAMVVYIIALICGGA